MSRIAKARSKTQIDIGFGDVVTPGPVCSVSPRQSMWHAFLKKNEITIKPLSEVVAKLRLILEPALVQAATLSVSADLVDVDTQDAP